MPNELIITNCSVTSVNGRAGAVTLTMDDIPEGDTNVAFTREEKEKLDTVDELLDLLDDEHLDKLAKITEDVIALEEQVQTMSSSVDTLESKVDDNYRTLLEAVNGVEAELQMINEGGVE